MIVGAYFSDGRVLVAPLEQAASLMGVTDYILRQTLNGKHVLRGCVPTKLPNDTPHRIPKEVPKVK